MAVKMPIRCLGTRSMSVPLASLAVINEKQGGRRTQCVSGGEDLNDIDQ